LKILALYTTRSLPILRRVQAPFSVLTQRGHNFTFMQVPQFDASLSMSHEITILPNWILTDQENQDLADAVQKGRFFAYDLSDPDLLQKQEVRDTLRLCRLITVPNEYMQKEVKIAVRAAHVEILPSTLDIPYMMTANTYPVATRKIIGCAGPYDWALIKDLLTSFKEVSPRALLIGDAPAKKALGDLITLVDITMETYPLYLRQCLVGLAPLETERGYDHVIVEQEYGLLCKPVIRFNKSVEQQKDFWVKEIQRFLNDPKYRSLIGQVSHDIAKKWSAFQLADQYLKVYRRILQHSLMSY
jgi:hypothetical protein